VNVLSPEPHGPAGRDHTNRGSARDGRRLAAVAFMDIVGYSILMAQDEARTYANWMKILAEIVRPTSHQHRGRVVKSTGDGVLAEFPSAFDAVDWALDIQRSLREEKSRDNPQSPPISVRIAVHIGDIVTNGGDIYGDGVNVTARLQEHAAPDGIVMSEAVHDLVRGSLGLTARDLGSLHLKNFPKPVRAFALDPEVRAGVAMRAHSHPTALPSIAVLPLRNLSGDPNDEYFADGVVGDIIVSLAGLRELLVIAHGSSLAIGRRQTDPRDVGHALGVRYVMSGSIRRSAQLVRVSVQLHDIQTGASPWADTAELPPGELFDLQDRIVGRIVAGIAPHIRAAELRTALRKHPESFTAYDCTLRGLDFINSLEKATFLRAPEYLERAMREDPEFAMPVALAARWHSMLIGQGWSSNRGADAGQAAALAVRAIELDRQNAMALATYGHLRSFLFHDYDTALVYFDRALAACPNSPLAWILSSGTLSYIGRGEQAVRHAERALRLSPFDQSLAWYYMFVGLAHYGHGSYEEAVKWGRLSLSENPNYTANLRILSAALAGLGRLDEAAATAGRLTALEPEFGIAEYARSLQPFRDPDIAAKYLAHLRAAGLPP
jgi:adenylate cyclase